MGNPIQYRNTDNKGGFVKWLQYAPPGAYPEGGLVKTLHRTLLKRIFNESSNQALLIFPSENICLENGIIPNTQLGVLIHFHGSLNVHVH